MQKSFKLLKKFFDRKVSIMRWSEIPEDENMPIDDSWMDNTKPLNK